MALVEQDAGCTSTGVKGAPAGRTAVGRAGLTQPGGRRAQSASLLLFNLQQLVWEHVTVFFPMCVPSCRVIVELLVIKRVLEREVEVEVSEVSCGPFSLGRAALSDGFALLFPLLTPSSSSCPLTSSFTGSPRGLQGSARVGSGWRGGRSTDWRAATEVCKQPCGLGSSSAFLSRRSGPPVPASCLEMLTKWNQMKPALLLLLAFSISLGIHRNVLTQLELSSSYFVLRKPTSRFFAAFLSESSSGHCPFIKQHQHYL